MISVQYLSEELVYCTWNEGKGQFIYDLFFCRYQQYKFMDQSWLLQCFKRTKVLLVWPCVPRMHLSYPNTMVTDGSTKAHISPFLQVSVIKEMPIVIWTIMGVTKPGYVAPALIMFFFFLLWKVKTCKIINR